MKLLIYTHAFAPLVGGIETYTMLLARRLSEVAQTDPESVEVTVVTQAQARDMDDSVLPFRVVRRPGLARLVGMVREADVVHVASATFVPMLLAWVLRKPAVVDHEGYTAACPNGLLL